MGYQMNFRFLKVAFVGLVFSFSGLVNAGLIQIQDNIADDQYISGTSSGVFNLNDILESDPNFNNPYDINSATVRFIFADDSSDSIVDQSNRTDNNAYTTSYTTCGWRHSCRDQYDYHYNYDREDYDNALVSTMDGNFSSNSISTLRSLGSTTVSEGYSWFYSNRFYYTYNYDRTYNYIYDHGYTNWSLDLTLSSLALDSLSSTGFFDFGVSAQDGTDFLLRSAVMTVDITENPAPVPEPSTFAIFALGMIGLASLRFNKQ